jgi:transcriptional regulator with XRE-family HTH domain
MLRQCIEPLGLTIAEAAEALGVTRNTLSERFIRRAPQHPSLPRWFARRNILS